jgi:16S rRNA (adenine1518-N6/adenine1519-N6)-dimethyltransferase
MMPVRPRKSLGQSFLVYQPTAAALVNALALGPGDTVVEIGPGKGVLTRRLVAQAGRVVAVEIDRRLVEYLDEKLGGNENLELVHADFLKWDQVPTGPFKVIGNLPYNVSSQVLFRLLDDIPGWTTVVLTTQREFARRVLSGAGSKTYGALSVFCEFLCARAKLFDIPATRFRPRPRVVSTSFRLERRPQPLFEVEDEAFFRSVIRSGFRQRRKMLVNNLAAEFGLPREQLLAVLQSSGIDGRARAEAVDIHQFRLLAERLAGVVNQSGERPAATSSSR